MVAGAGVLWVLAGRWVTLIADSVWTKRVEVRKLASLSLSSSSLRIGDLVLETDGELFRKTADGKLQLVWQGRGFVLGPMQPSGPDEYDVTPEQGDEASLQINDSLLSWPTPFELNFMTGVSPSWKAYRHYRLSWKKRGGETLGATWRYERWFYPANGWTGGNMTSAGATGLRDVQF
jgi:hypothetical protein